MSKQIRTKEQAKKVFLDMVSKGKYKPGTIRKEIAKMQRRKYNVINKDNVEMGTLLADILQHHSDNYVFRAVVGEGEE